MSTPTWLAAVERLAPTIASAFGTPLLGMGVSALESALGITGGDGKSTDKIQQAIESGSLTGEQIAAMKKADQDFAAKMKELDVQLDQMQLADIEGARQMQTAKPSPMPAVITILAMLAFFAVLGALLAGIRIPGGEAASLMIGALISAFSDARNFWLGSTRHSQTTASLNAQTVASAAGR